MVSLSLGPVPYASKSSSQVALSLKQNLVRSWGLQAPCCGVLQEAGSVGDMASDCFPNLALSFVRVLSHIFEKSCLIHVAQFRPGEAPSPEH